MGSVPKKMMLLAFAVTMEHVSSSLSIIQNEGRRQERKHGLMGKDMGLVKTEAHRECTKASLLCHSEGKKGSFYR